MSNNNDLSKLHQIEGFNPNDYARILRDEKTGEQTAYLDVKYRILWFHLRYPEGKISKKILKLDNGMAVVEARIYANNTDPEDTYIANGYGQRFYDNTSVYGLRFLELAETASVGRALSSAGFNLVSSNDDTEPTPVDSGIQISSSNAPEISSQTTPSSAKPTQQPMNPIIQTIPVQNAPMANIPQSLPQPNYTASTPVDEILQLMTLEEAKGVIVNIGIKKGKTLGIIATESPKSLEWYVTSYKGNDNILRAAAKKLLDAAMTQQAV